MKSKFERQRQTFIYRMNKQSPEREVYMIVKPLKSWELGITFIKLIEKVSKRLKRKRLYSENRIRHAISLINKFGKDYGIYMRSAWGWVVIEDNQNKVEYRYFTPIDQDEISREHKKLGNIKDVSELKNNNLINYEEKIIPQEKEIEVMREQH